MATVLHSALTSTNLHEPKGADSASEGQVYIADGAGSGTWTFWPTGWGFYKDDGADQVVGTTAVKMSIDAAGSLTNEDYLPREIRGVDSLWDEVNDKITPIRAGDQYDLRIELPVTAKSGSPSELTLQFDIGGSATPTVVILERYSPTAKAAPYTISVGLPLIGLSAATITNGVQIFLKTDTGTVTVSKPAITIARNHDGNF